MDEFQLDYDSPLSFKPDVDIQTAKPDYNFYVSGPIMFGEQPRPAISLAKANSKEALEKLKKEICRYGFQKSILEYEPEKYEVIYYICSCPEVSDAIGLRSRFLGIFPPPLSAAEVARMCYLFGKDENECEETKERLAKREFEIRKKEIFKEALEKRVNKALVEVIEQLPPEKHKLVVDNLGLATKIAQKYFGQPDLMLDSDDLVQIAWMGLIRAARSFDESLGFTFGTYATRVIKTELHNEIQKFYAKKRAFVPRMRKVFSDPNERERLQREYDKAYSTEIDAIEARKILRDVGIDLSEDEVKDLLPLTT